MLFCNSIVEITVKSIWLGQNPLQSKYIFILPNLPKWPNEMDFSRPNVMDLIELNGNHWRKILTIMAKLTVSKEGDWQTHRDHTLFEQLAVTFDVASFKQFKDLSKHTRVFIVGGKLRTELPVSQESTKLSYECWHQANYVWCPYLDYRQFPNALVNELRDVMSESF